MRKKFDAGLLSESVDIRDILNRFGIQSFRRGSVFFVHCPNPAHEDAHPSAYYKDGWHYVQCRSCCRRYSAIDIIRFETGMSFADACCDLYEFAGRPPGVTEEPPVLNSRNAFCPTAEELRTAGIHIPREIEVQAEFSTLRIYLSEDIPKGYYFGDPKEPGYLLCRKEKVSRNDFSDQLNFAWYVLQRCWEALPVSLGKEKEILSRLEKKAERFLLRQQKP